MDWSPPPLRLYVTKGSFFTADDGPAMNAKVWSKLPEELIWEVLRFVPAAAHFRLQLVSRKWRQVLTSAHFRNTLATEPEKEQRVVACLTHGYDDAPGGDDDSKNNSSGSKVKVVDIDLSSFVPSWFRKSDGYSVVAAADGLVCVSNDSNDEKRNLGYWVAEAWDFKTTRYCVLNPLTRSCKVLPQVPLDLREWLRRRGWLSPTPSAALSIYWHEVLTAKEEGHLHVTTYNLDASSSGGWELAATESLFLLGEREADPVVARCGGEIYMYFLVDISVMEVVGGTVAVSLPGGKLEPVASLFEPKWASLGVDDSQYANLYSRRSSGPYMVAHRGAIFFVKAVRMRDGVDMLIGVWRLARERLEWEAVALLDGAELVRLTGRECINRKRVMPDVEGMCGVRESLYCSILVDSTQFVLGLNLDTGVWQLVQTRDHISARVVELRPGLFLS